MIYSETSSHTNTASPRLFLLHHWPEVDFVLSVSDGAFRIAVPTGDWADYLPQDPVPRTAYETVPALDEDGRPFVDEDGQPVTVQQEIAVYDAQPDLRVPRDPWLWYQQEHGIETPQPTPEQVLAWTPPDEEPESSEPLTDVEIAIRGAAENFEKARLAAPKALDRLKGTIHTALVSGGMSSGEATAAGVGLVLLHGPLLAAFEAAGGHPKAAEALYVAIASPESVAALPWLTEGILAIFASALAPTP